jgi:hypothetical protein
MVDDGECHWYTVSHATLAVKLKKYIQTTPQIPFSGPKAWSIFVLPLNCDYFLIDNTV